MKKKYIKPMVEIERYALDASIAANCGNVVTLGPGNSQNSTCKEFRGDEEVAMLAIGSTSFYEVGDGDTSCDCYYSSSGAGYFTS